MPLLSRTKLRLYVASVRSWTLSAIIICALGQFFAPLIVPVANATPLVLVQQDDTESQNSSSSQPLEFSDLDTYYLRNSSGDLIPVFKFSFEDFERLMRMQDQDTPLASDLVTSYQISAATFQGNVNSNLGQASMRLTLDVQASQAGRFEIPLGLSQWAISGAVETSGTTVSMARDDKRQLILAFNAQPDSRYQFVIPLYSQVRTVGDTQQLKFEFPHTTKTDFELTIDNTNLTLAPSGMVAVKSTATKDTTTVTARELSETAKLVWREANEDSIRFQTKAQITTTSTLETVSSKRWQATSNIQIRPFAQPVSELVFVAPANANDFAVVQSGARLNKITWEQAVAKTSYISESLKNRQFLALSMRPTSDPVDLTLTYLLETPEVRPNQSVVEFTIDGLQVIDCVFLSGTLDLVTSQRDWDTTLVTSSGMTPTFNRSSTKEGKTFEISRQDYRLTLTARQRPAQISIAPEYTLAPGGGVDGKIAILTVKFNCSVQGQYSDTLSVPLNNWALLQGRGINEVDGQLKLNPAERSDLSSNSVTFEFSVQRTLEDEEIDLRLPVPLNSSNVIIEPAKLIVVPMVENREFQLDAKSSAFEINNQIARSSTSSTLGTAEYRSKSGTDGLRLKGSISLKPRIIEYSQTVDLLPPLDEFVAQDPLLSVRQTILIDIKNQPLERLWFLAKHVGPQARLAVSGSDIENMRPQTITFRTKELTIMGETWYAVEPIIRDWQLRGEFLFEWEDHALPPTSESNRTQITQPQTASQESTSENSRQSWNIAILQPMLTPTVELTNIATEADLNRELDKQTAEFKIRQRSLSTPTDSPLEYQLDSNWVEAKPDDVESNKQRWFAFGRWPSQADVVSVNRWSNDGLTTVEDAELQTWWQEGQRLDRLVVGVTNSGKTLSLTIPAASRLEQVLVDGRAHNFGVVGDDQKLNLSFSKVEQRDYQIIELWLSRQESARWWHSIKPQLPKFPNHQWCRNFRWKIFAASDWRCVSWESIFFQPESDTIGFSNVNLPSSSRASDTTAAFADYINATTSFETGQPIVMAANQLPVSESILLANRFPMRLIYIALAFALVIGVWGSGTYRSFYLWIFLGFAFAIAYAAEPLLFSDALPLLSISALVGIAVLLIDSFSRSKPKIIMEMDTFVGSTRTMSAPLNDAAISDSNRSHDSQTRSHSNSHGTNGNR